MSQNPKPQSRPYRRRSPEMLPIEVREAILAGNRNHEYWRDGFCLHCKIHRTDWMRNNLCPVRMEKGV